MIAKDELQKFNCDLVELSAEAKNKEEELKILKEFKKELEVLCTAIRPRSIV